MADSDFTPDPEAPRRPPEQKPEESRQDESRVEKGERERVFTRGRKIARTEVRGSLAATEARMLERLCRHFDMPITQILRLLIREKYEELYGDSPEPEMPSTGTEG